MSFGPNHRVGAGLRGSFAPLILVMATVSGSYAQMPPPVPGSGRIVSLTGALTLRRAAMPPQSVKLNEMVQAGDELVTGSNSEAVIQTSDGSAVRIFPDSRVVFSEGSPGIRGFLHLFLGSIKVQIEKVSGRPNPHTLTTPTAIIGVRGTTFSVFVDETDSTLVAVDAGIVAVSNVRLPSQEILLRRGQRTWVRPGQPPMVAARFRGPSEHADMLPGRGSSGMHNGTAGAMGMWQGGGGSHGMGAMGGRGGPPR